MSDPICVACGRSIVAVRASRALTLQKVWAHRSWWANRSHYAIPEGMLRDN